MLPLKQLARQSRERTAWILRPTLPVGVRHHSQRLGSADLPLWGQILTVVRGGNTEGISSYIHGDFVSSSSANSHRDLVNPATGARVCSFEIASQEQVNESISSSIDAQKTWSKISAAERAKVLIRTADILDSRNDEIARVEAFDTGRPLQETLVVDVKSATDCLRFTAGILQGKCGQYVELSGPGDSNGSFCIVKREPLGVTAGIGAWNYPLQGCVWKAAPSLAAGNSMIFKPSEETPLTALVLAQAFIEAGAPKGLFNVILGSGETGRQLCEHPEIKKVSFTGSLETGRLVAQSAGYGLKKMTLELGGKSPLIVFEDADLDAAVSAAMVGNWYSCGEVCSNATRVFVNNSCKEAFLKLLAERTRKLKIGDPLLMDTQIGPLISRTQFDKVKEYVAVAREEGAKVICGGMEHTFHSDVGDLKNGYFFEPAIIDHVEDTMTVAREEIFGPVMSLMGFDSEEEVVERANATPYGLAAGVYTSDLRRAHRMAALLQAGTVWINNYNLTPVEVPWGGHKASGVGFENGNEAINQWTQPKTVYIEMGKIDSPYP